VRYDTITSISCIDKALQASVSVYSFKRALQKFPVVYQLAADNCFAQFIAVCRRAKMVAIDPRRPRRGSRLCRR